MGSVIGDTGFPVGVGTKVVVDIPVGNAVGKPVDVEELVLAVGDVEQVEPAADLDQKVQGHTEVFAFVHRRKLLCILLGLPVVQAQELGSEVPHTSVLGQENQT